MKRRTGILIAAAAVVLVAAGTATALVASGSPGDGSARDGRPAVSGTSPGATAPAAASPAPTAPAPTASLTPAQAQVLDYVRTLPTVQDVTPQTVDEFTELVCTTLRSPRMSADFYAKIIAVETQGYSLTAAQADELLAVTARAACPDALRVVDSRGAQPAATPAP